VESELPQTSRKFFSVTNQNNEPDAGTTEVEKVDSQKGRKICMFVTLAFLFVAIILTLIMVFRQTQGGAIISIFDERHPEFVTKDIVYGDEKLARHHATPVPDGSHYISGIRVCKAAEDNPEIVGLQVTTTSTVDFKQTVQPAQGYMTSDQAEAEELCSQQFQLLANDCIQYFNIAFDPQGGAVGFIYATKQDKELRSIGYAEGEEDSSKALDFGKDGCMVSMDVGFSATQ
jgi:hypothetical protein